MGIYKSVHKITYYENPNISRTNNKIEGCFNLTLLKNLKRKYRTAKGQMAVKTTHSKSNCESKVIS